MPVPSNYYSNYTGTIVAGVILYSDTALTTPVPDGYYSDGTNCYYVDQFLTGVPGKILQVNACPPPTTVAPIPPCVDCCFIGSTFISMKDGSKVAIKDIEISDEVISFNEIVGENQSNKVKRIITKIANSLVKYTITGGIVIESTEDHPIYVNGLTIASNAPLETISKYKFEFVKQIEVGDAVNLINNTIAYIESIEVTLSNERVYTLEVDNNHNYFANDVLVHNKTFDPICCTDLNTGEQANTTLGNCCCLNPNNGGNWIQIPCQ